MSTRDPKISLRGLRCLKTLDFSRGGIFDTPYVTSRPIFPAVEPRLPPPGPTRSTSLYGSSGGCTGMSPVFFWVLVRRAGVVVRLMQGTTPPKAGFPSHDCKAGHHHSLRYGLEMVTSPPRLRQGSAEAFRATRISAPSARGMAWLPRQPRGRAYARPSCRAATGRTRD